MADKGAAGAWEDVGLSSNMPDDLWSLLPPRKCFCFPQGVHGENNPRKLPLLRPFFRVWFVNFRDGFRDTGDAVAL